MWLRQDILEDPWAPQVLQESLSRVLAFILISKQVDDRGGRENYKILEDVFEAFLGALII